MKSIDVFLTKHGDYDVVSGNLTSSGKEQAAKVAGQLSLKSIGGVGLRAVVLSSPVERAVQTAHIVADALGSPMVQDEQLAEYGQYPRKIRRTQNLDFLLEEIYTSQNLESLDPRALVLVTHHALIASLLGFPANEIRYEGQELKHGMVFKYTAPGAIALSSEVSEVKGPAPSVVAL